MYVNKFDYYRIIVVKQISLHLKPLLFYLKKNESSRDGGKNSIFVTLIFRMLRYLRLLTRQFSYASILTHMIWVWGKKRNGDKREENNDAGSEDEEHFLFWCISTIKRLQLIVVFFWWITFIFEHVETFLIKVNDFDASLRRQ